MSNKSRAIYSGKISFALRGGFLVRPLVLALLLGLVGCVLPRLELTHPAIDQMTPGILFPVTATPVIAQAVLVTIAGALMTVVSIVFAILLMSLTLASMQYSPRIIISFTMDRVTQWTLGIFLGTFSFCLCVLPSLRTVEPVFVPTLSLDTSMLLALICVALLLYFIHHISQAISVNHIVDRLASDTEAMIDQMMPHPRPAEARDTSTPVVPEGANARILSERSGYIRHLDIEGLVKVAKKHDLEIHILRRVGHFTPAGVSVAAISKAERLTSELSSEIEQAFDIGPTRTLQQDIEFGILQIVDIALRAISPAVNDPSTGISCVDQLSRLLIRCATREQAESQFFDPPGTLRVSMPVQDLHRLIHAAFDQIRLYSKGDIAVSLRILRALGDIAEVAPAQETRKHLASIGHHVLAGTRRSTADQEDLAEMQHRVQEIDRLAARS